jgi:hypothetical protein
VGGLRKSKVVITWNELPRWVQRQRNWYRKHRQDLDAPEPEPLWGDDPLSQRLQRLYEAMEEKAASAAPQPFAWYEFEGDRAAERVLYAWIEHLRCPKCDMFETNDFGDEWGTVICSDIDCEYVWSPVWATPWGPPTPKSKKPKKYTVGECPMCGKQNRRLNPQNQYDFVCHPSNEASRLPEFDFMRLLFLSPEEIEREEHQARVLAEQLDAAYQASCHNRYWTGLIEGWYRYLPAWYPYCRGCGALFVARLEDQEFCSRDCGRMPKDFSKRLRQMATRASPTLRRQDVFERDNWICHICDKEIDPRAENRVDRPSLDHVIPIAAGGTHTLENVRASHLRCNIQKSDSLLDEDEFMFLRSLLHRSAPPKAAVESSGTATQSAEGQPN